MSKTSRELLADPSAKLRRRVYGRRLGRPLNMARREALENLLPALSVPDEYLSGDGNCDPQKLFSKSFQKIWLEIGFGNGEHLNTLMQQHPDVGFLGAEPFINGMAAFLKSIQDSRQDNIRVLMDDAMLLVNSLTHHSLERIYVLNPDPWPKKRHHKRRMIRQENLDSFARVLAPGGLLVMATDVDDLAEWMVTECMNHPSFTWTAKGPQDWRQPPVDWPLLTRYAEKGLRAGRKQTYLVFRREK